MTERREKSREDKAAGWAVLCIFGVLFAAWGAYLAVAVGLLLGKMPWLLVHVEPAGWMLAKWGGYGLVPLCVILAMFRRTRLMAGMGLFAVSGIFTLATCASAAIYVYYVWKWVGLTVGTLMVGYGILPAALLAALTHHRWDIASLVGSGAIMLFSTLYFGLTLMTLSFSASPGRRPPGPPENEENPAAQAARNSGVSDST